MGSTVQNSAGCKHAYQERGQLRTRRAGSKPHRCTSRSAAAEARQSHDPCIALGTLEPILDPPLTTSQMFPQTFFIVYHWDTFKVCTVRLRSAGCTKSFATLHVRTLQATSQAGWH